MSGLFGYLRDLCQLDGGSGDESAVREYIISKIKGRYDYTVDPLGNLIVGNGNLMICAHMDEVSMIVTSVKKDGSLTVSPVGGIDAAAVSGGRVTVNGLNGVIGSKAVHNMTADEKKKRPEFSKLCADIGAADKEEAERHVTVGDRVYFDSEYAEFGDGLIKAKAIDDRFGCAALLELLENNLPDDCAFVFTVQEELGGRGAKAAAYTVNPETALVIETTTAADIPAVKGEKRCCSLGGGAVVPFMDKYAIYDKELYALSKTIARENGIKWQTKTVVAGGNDSGSIQTANGGVKTLAISAPCRNLHSPACVAKRSDLEECVKLAGLMIEGIRGGKRF